MILHFEVDIWKLTWQFEWKLNIASVVSRTIFLSDMWTCKYKAIKEAINSIDINQILQYFKLNQFFKSWCADSSNEIDRHHISKFLYKKHWYNLYMCTYIEDRKICNTLTFNFKLNFRILETKVDILLLEPI